jgi:hypothetical protein
MMKIRYKRNVFFFLFFNHIMRIMDFFLSIYFFQKSLLQLKAFNWQITLLLVFIIIYLSQIQRLFSSSYSWGIFFSIKSISNQWSQLSSVYSYRGFHHNSNQSFSTRRSRFRTWIQEKWFIIKLLCSTNHYRINIRFLS